MRILIPAHQMGSGGLGTSIRGLVEHLPAALGPDDELIILRHSLDGRKPTALRTRVARLLHEQVGVARAARTVDLVHLPDHRPLLASRTPFLLTVYDLLFFDRPEWFPAAVARYKQLMLRAALAKRPAAVVCGSHYARLRLLERFPAIEEPRVRVIYPGIDPPPHAVRQSASSDGGYFLTVNTIEPRKNHLGLLRAFRRARARGLDLRWKVVGAPGYAAAPIVDELRADERVDLVGWVSAEELEQLYAAARFVVYPSLGEGFGFPPLEAMARGVPVACSMGTALDESVGDAALLVEPADERGWTEALLRLAGDDEERERLRAAGLERVRRFQWPHAAAEYAQTYRDALERA